MVISCNRGELKSGLYSYDLLQNEGPYVGVIKVSVWWLKVDNLFMLAVQFILVIFIFCLKLINVNIVKKFFLL